MLERYDVMVYLPLANILHHKLRTALSVLGIGIGIGTVVTLSGLSRGSLSEVADRWESVDADLIVFPRGWGGDASVKSGSGLWDSLAGVIRARHADEVSRVVPVFTWPIDLAGQDQMAAGVDRDDWTTLAGGRDLAAGRLFRCDYPGFLARMKSKAAGAPDGVVDIDEQDLADCHMLELVIDSRLAAAGGYRLGQDVFAANHRWTVVGIVPAGAMSRVFMPRRTAQFLFGNADTGKSTLMFVKLAAGVDVGPAAKAIAETVKQDVVPLDRYRGMLKEKFGIMFLYVDAVNAVALIIAFLFVTVTLHTTVLQRTREIAILKSSGASGLFIIRQVLAEAALLAAAGAAVGIALSFPAGWAIERFRPLLTVTITLRWIAVGAAAAAVGALVSGLYPAWRAMRVDVVEAWSFE